MYLNLYLLHPLICLSAENTGFIKKYCHTLRNITCPEKQLKYGII